MQKKLFFAPLCVDPESVKNTVKLLVSFYTFGICSLQKRMQNDDEIDPGSFKDGTEPRIVLFGAQKLYLSKHTSSEPKKSHFSSKINNFLKKQPNLTK